MADYNEIEQRILDMWPKFEDGCYVQLGDKVVANSGENKGREFIVRNVYFENGHGKLRSSVSDGCYWNWKSADTRVKRPAPKALDAEGVEIKVGDTVYSIRTGAKCKVEGIEGDGVIKTDDEYGLKWRIINSHDVTHKQPVRDMDGVLIEVGDKVWGIGDINPATVVEVDGDAVHVQYFDGFIFEHKAAQLSHERPDSWERLEEDAEKGNCEYLGRSQSSCDGCYLNGKSACDEYVRIDLVRRAKALAEKEAAR